jgi:transposase
LFSLEGRIDGTSPLSSTTEQEEKHYLHQSRLEPQPYGIHLMRVICPPGKVSTKWRPGQDAFGNPIIALKFSRSDGKSCPVRSLCARCEAAPRHIVLHPREQHEALYAARERITTEEGKAQYQVRAGVEGTLSQGVRAFSLRRTRYCGLAKTSLPQAVTAAAIHVRRVVNWLEGVPPEKIRRSQFARLAIAS